MNPWTIESVSVALLFCVYNYVCVCVCVLCLLALAFTLQRHRDSARLRWCKPVSNDTLSNFESWFHTNPRSSIRSTMMCSWSTLKLEDNDSPSTAALYDQDETSVMWCRYSCIVLSVLMLMLNLKLSFQSFPFDSASGFDLILLVCPAQSSVMWHAPQLTNVLHGDGGLLILSPSTFSSWAAFCSLFGLAFDSPDLLCLVLFNGFISFLSLLTDDRHYCSADPFLFFWDLWWDLWSFRGLDLLSSDPIHLFLIAKAIFFLHEFLFMVHISWNI